jgi:uncharacterized protein (TIGR00730 family)
VYGAASPNIDDKYKKEVEKLGREMAQRGHSLVFGGGGHGLMGAIAVGVHEEGGYIKGVCPKFFFDEGIEFLCDFCDEMVIPETMRQRKQIMEDSADAFIVTPGGIGTFEEFFEILTARQLCLHTKPIAIFNAFGYYDMLSKTIDEAISKSFVKSTCSGLYFISEDINELLNYLETTTTETHTVKDFKEG